MRAAYRASSASWLHCVRQNWCTYGVEHPKKDTVILCNVAPSDVLFDKLCAEHCRHPTPRRHEVKIKNMQRGARAAWPVGFVEVALRACVRHMHALG
jgi:hypothetical protein